MRGEGGEDSGSPPLLPSLARTPTERRTTGKTTGKSSLTLTNDPHTKREKGGRVKVLRGRKDRGGRNGFGTVKWNG